MAETFGFVHHVCIGLMAVLMTMTTSGYVSCQDDFYFRKWPVSPQGTIRSGQSVELECRVSTEDRISISWTLNGELLTNSSRRYQNAVTGDLIIRRADHRLDSGSFACTATNISSGFSIASQPATLNIQWITNTTRIKAQAGGQTLVEDASTGLALFHPGDQVILTCMADGSGDIQFDWFHNGRKVARNKTKQLVLDPISVTESGTYTCTAKNGAGHSKYNVPFGLTSGKMGKLVRFAKETVATLDSTVRLPCPFSSTTPVEWFFRGVLLSSTPHYLIEVNGDLVISKIHAQHEGWYHCRHTKNGQTEEYGSHLKIAYLNEFSKSSIDPPPPLSNGFYYFAEYSTAELTCIAPDGLPAPTVWWEGPSGHILTQISYSMESVLVLNRVLQQDTGVYRCRAENLVRNVTIPVNLIVTSPPIIQQHPASVSTNEDETASMSCVFSGAPAPATTVQWFKDGQPIVDTPKPVHGLRNSTLIFPFISKRSAGNYVCRVKTIGHPSIESQTATLHVREKLKFTVAPAAKTLELGTIRKILCKAQGSPAPIVRWVKEGRPLLNWPPHIEDLNGTLLFNGVQDGDAGQYTCIATNSQGLISATVFISVTISPSFTSLPSNVTHVKEGQRIELTCKAKGDPVPTIQWDKNSVMDGFLSDRFFVHPNGSLTIENVLKEDDGYYGCTAGNAGGFKRAEFRLVVEDWDHASHDGESIAKTIIITVGAAGAYILLSVGLLIWCRLRRRQRKLRSENDPRRCADTQLDTHTALIGKEDQVENGTSSVDKLNVPSSAITKGSLLGKGRFGDVIEGKVTGLKSSDTTSHILLRTLTTRDEDLMIEFRRQIDMLHRVRHVNLVAVLGCSRDPTDVQTVLMEFHQLCNLKTHLLSSSQPWSVSQIQSATVQIARGMNALALARYVHRDLGTRNILIAFHRDDQFCVKIGSFGMDKEPFGHDYFLYKHQSIALRWLPHEAVFEDEYSTKSDVWMFAVTVWELYHGARQPLSNRTDEAILMELKSKTNIFDTTFCKCNAMSSLLARCWSHDPILRPSFDELLRCAEAATTTNGRDLKTR